MEQNAISYAAEVAQQPLEARPSVENAKLFKLIYNGSLDEDLLQRAVEDRPISQKAKDQWHCSGIRKLLNGSLNMGSKNDLEKATAISRKISRFMIEQPESFAALPAADQEEIRRLHINTGSREWVNEEEQLLALKIESSSELLSEFGMNFSSTPAQELNQNLTGTEMVNFSWDSCGHRDYRAAYAINTAINKKKSPYCRECYTLDNSLITWYQLNEDFLLSSQVDISQVSSVDLLASAYSKTKINIGYGCGHRENTTFQSLKDKVKRAQELGQETISCNACKVPDGTFEVGIRMAIQLATAFVPGVTIEKQVELDGLKGKPYDMLIRLESGKLYFIEVDGGLHYKPFNRLGQDEFDRKIEVDREKTEAILALGHGLIRIDERNHRGEVTEELAAVLSAALRGTLGNYTVIGEECPGAQLVSDERKGWA